MQIIPEDMLIRLPKYVSSRIIDRSLDYFRNGFIEPPERVSEHKWATRAKGRRVYNVSLTFNPEGADEWHCDCPFGGTVCKHVVAASFDRLLAEIYVEEKLFDRLEEMLKNEAGNPYGFDSVCLYAPQMAEMRPEGAGEVMQQAIETYAAENVGRKYYRDIANQLRDMIEWRGGLRRVRNIVRKLIEEYPARRAMKEELEQVFSDRVRYM